MKNENRKELVERTFERSGIIQRMEDETSTEGQPSRMVKLSFSSEEPVERYDFIEEKRYLEVLSHKSEDVDLEFLGSGRAPLLLDHDVEKQIGVIERVSLGNGKASAEVRLGKSQLAEEVLTDIRDGIRQNVSVGYRLTKEIQSEETRDGLPVRVFGFSPKEISIVSIPADQSSQVGVGRKQEIEKQPKRNEVIMSEENNAPKIEKVLETVNPEDIRKSEQKNNSEIIELGRAHGMEQEAQDAVIHGLNVNEFRHQLLSKIGERSRAVAKVDVPKQEQKNYSLLRALDAAAKNDWSQAGFEREMSQEVELKTNRSARGFFVPDFGWNVGKRTLQNDSGSTYGAGSNVFNIDYRGDSFIEALIAESVLDRLGATVLQGLQGSVKIPVMTAAPSSAFTAEAASAGNSEPTFAQRTLDPKTLSNKIAVSRHLLAGSNPSIENWLRSTMIKVFATKLDNAALDGSGSGANPTGILNTAGIGDVESGGTSGNANLTYGNVVDIMTDVASANSLTGALRWVTHPAVVGKLMQTTKVASTDSVMIMNQSDSLLGYDLISTTSTTSASPYSLLFGDFSQLIVGFFSNLDILVDPYSSGGVVTNIFYFQEFDCAVGQPSAFSAAQDITV